MILSLKDDNSENGTGSRIWPKLQADVSGADIEGLVRDRVSESRHLEFKRQPSNTSDREMTRFLLPITAFANAGGGYLTFNPQSALQRISEFMPHFC